jgi:diguanylate cyclase (GGDEF)-like protein
MSTRIAASLRALKPSPGDAERTGVRATVRRKLIASFAAILVITAVVGLVGLWTIDAAEHNLDRVYERNVVGLLDLSAAQLALTDLATGGTGSDRVAREALGRLRASAASRQTQLAFERVQRAFDRWDAVRRTGHPSEAHLGELHGALHAFGLAKAERAQSRLARMNEKLAAGQFVLLGLVAVAILGGIAIALLLARDIGGRVKECAAFARCVAKGDLSARVTPRGADALAQLARDLNAMADELGAHQGDLERRALRDPLTDLLNHRAFQERMRDEIAHARRGRARLAVCVLDVDGFKTINDTWGHAAGDEALRLLAGVLAREFRDEDVVGRLGGDELAIGLPGAGGDEALRMLDRVRTALFAGGLSFPAGRLRTSAGVAELTGDADDLGELLAQADAAMYRAKRQGGDQACAAEASPPGVLPLMRERVPSAPQRRTAPSRPVPQVAAPRAGTDLWDHPDGVFDVTEDASWTRSRGR